MMRALMASPQSDAGESARTRIAWRLLPFLFLLYVANYLDRTNIAYATLGMKGDLGLTDSVFGTASGIFFIGYLGLQIPGALLVERWSAKRLLAITLITWGALTTLTGFVRSPLQLYGARFLLGAAEAGFFPGVIVYLSHWFIVQDRGKAVARFMSAIPIAYIFGGPLAGAILGVDWLGVPGWRWLFLLEGVPAIVLGTATFFVLPDRPNEVRWLRADEREWLTSRLGEERQAKAHLEHVTIWQALRHPAVLLLTAGLFFCYTGGYAFWFWFPTMLQRLTGWTDVQRIGWVGAIPFVAGLIGMLLLGWNSDRTRERRWHFAYPATDRCGCPGSLVFPPAFDRPACDCVLAYRLRHHCLSAVVLGAAEFTSLHVGGSRGGRFHQLHRQHRRIRRSQDHWQPEPEQRLVPRRIYLYDCLLDHRVAAGPALPA